jgi:hypothetical protein
VSSTLSDPLLLFAFWAGLVSVALTAAIALSIVGMRLRLRVQQARWEAFLARWRPLLLGAMIDPQAPPLPPLRAGDRLRFLRLWTYLHSSVRGGAGPRLNALARELHMDAVARHLLQRGSRTARLQAVLAAGLLRDAEALEPLLQLAASRDSLLSVNAAGAAVDIDPILASARLFPLILSRPDWDPTRVAGFLQGAREPFALLLVRSLGTMPPQDLPRALRMVAALRIQLPPATLRGLLEPAQPPQVLRAALALATSQAFGREVRALVDHPDGEVRAQAVRQLSLLGGPDDLPALARRLEDPHWPARMAAAQTLAQLPFVEDHQLEQLAAETTAGGEIMQHILAERALA